MLPGLLAKLVRGRPLAANAILEGSLGNGKTCLQSVVEGEARRTGGIDVTTLAPSRLRGDANRMAELLLSGGEPPAGGRSALGSRRPLAHGPHPIPSGGTGKVAAAA